MNAFVISLLIAFAAGIIDIIPMIIKKLDKRSIISAFFQYFLVSIVIINISLPVHWWIKGGLVSFALALPIMIIVSEKDKKAIPVIASMSVIIGTIVGAAAKFLLK